MKLAEALLLRGEMQTKLAKLRERLGACAVVQEGDKPSEDPRNLLLESAGLLDELYTLVARINRTNMSHKLPDGRVLTDAIAERDRLRQHVALISFAAASTTGKRDEQRYSYREIKWVPQLDAGVLHKQVDDLSKKLRELNAKIQETNWKIDLQP